MKLTQELPRKNGDVRAIHNSQQMVGGHAGNSMKQSDAERLQAEITTAVPSSFFHDLNQVPVFCTSPERIQSKLAVSISGDQYEQEADSVADKVTHMSAPKLQRICACGGGCQQCKKEQAKQSHIRTKCVQGTNPDRMEVPPVVREVLRSSGKPLAPATRAFFEARFGQDFSMVRVHTDVRASEAAVAVRAKAFAFGNDMVFRKGYYAPETGSGKHLLAHELAHVVQQSCFGATQRIQRQPIGQGATNSVALSGGSLSSIYERQILSHIEKGNYVRGYLWTLLFTSHDALTFGFLSTHDPTYEKWERGEITEDEYLGHTLRATGRSAAIGTAVVLTGGVTGAGARGLMLGLGARASSATIASGGVAGASASAAGLLSADVYDATVFGDKEFTNARGYAIAIGSGFFLGAGIGAYANSLAGGAPILNRLQGGVIEAQLPFATRAIQSLQSRLIISGVATGEAYQGTLLGRMARNAEFSAFSTTRRLIGVSQAGQGPVIIDTNLVRGRNVPLGGEERIAPESVNELISLAVRESRPGLVRTSIGFDRLGGVQESQAGTAQVRAYLARFLPADTGFGGDVNLLATAALENGTFITADVNTIVRPLTQAIVAGIANGRVGSQGLTMLLVRGTPTLVLTQTVTVSIPSSDATLTVVGVTIP